MTRSSTMISGAWNVCERLKRAGLVTLLGGALAFSVYSPAEAGRRHHHHHGAVGAGVAGFAAGAVIGSMLSQRYSNYGSSYAGYGPGYAGYYRPNYYVGSRPYPPPYSYPMPIAPQPYDYGRPAPWTPQWYDYCFARYRSFDPRTGYFTAYSGRKVFCR
ncbi:BA14K family protein [Breoghania corrubedonensis]|nr:BA14K family protein [Breoghania corrubedonensis]